MKILIVEDKAEFRKIAEKATEKFPRHEYLVVDNAAHAIELIENDKIDAVITDFYFPRTQEVDPKKYDAYLSEYKKASEHVLYQLGWNKANEEYDIERNLEALEDKTTAAYGGIIALLCHDRCMPFTIIAEARSHCRYGLDGYSYTKQEVYGVWVYSPFVSRGCMHAKDLLKNFHPLHLQNKCKKNQLEVWERSIEMVLSQPSKETEKIKRRKAKAKATRERKEAEAKATQKKIEKIRQMIGESEVSKELMDHLYSLLDSQDGYTLKYAKIIKPNAGVYVRSRSLPRNGAGIGYFDQANAFVDGQLLTEEWMWRSPYHAYDDRKDLRVDGIKDASIIRSRGKIEVLITFWNSYCEAGYFTQTLSYDPEVETRRIKTAQRDSSKKA